MGAQGKSIERGADAGAPRAKAGNIRVLIVEHETDGAVRVPVKASRPDFLIAAANPVVDTGVGGVSDWRDIAVQGVG